MGLLTAFRSRRALSEVEPTKTESEKVALETVPIYGDMENQAAFRGSGHVSGVVVCVCLRKQLNTWPW